jgi:hypothetical protein
MTVNEIRKQLRSFATPYEQALWVQNQIEVAKQGHPTISIWMEGYSAGMTAAADMLSRLSYGLERAPSITQVDTEAV